MYLNKDNDHTADDGVKSEISGKKHCCLVDMLKTSVWFELIDTHEICYIFQ